MTGFLKPCKPQSDWINAPIESYMSNWLLSVTDMWYVVLTVYGVEFRTCGLA